MHDLGLDLFFEDAEDRAYADQAAADLQVRVAELAPWITLRIAVAQSTDLHPWIFRLGGDLISTIWHPPSSPGRQSLVITRQDFGRNYGFGARCFAVVSKLAMDRKKASGADPTDIVLHEWLHTLEGMEINGRQVPNADAAERSGFTHDEIDAHRDPRWSTWFRYCLGDPSVVQPATS